MPKCAFTGQASLFVFQDSSELAELLSVFAATLENAQCLLTRQAYLLFFLNFFTRANLAGRNRSLVLVGKNLMAVADYKSTLKRRLKSRSVKAKSNSPRRVSVPSHPKFVCATGA